MQISPSFKTNIHKLSEAALSELMALFGDAIDSESMAKAPRTLRDRTFTPRVTFWAFLSQILTPGSSCRHAVLKVQSLLLSLKQPLVSTSTSAYCQARSCLSSCLLNSVQERVVAQLEAKILSRDLWMKRHVKIVDASSTSLPDTPINQKRWPQATC